MPSNSFTEKERVRDETRSVLEKSGFFELSRTEAEHTLIILSLNAVNNSSY